MVLLDVDRIGDLMAASRFTSWNRFTGRRSPTAIISATRSSRCVSAWPPTPRAVASSCRRAGPCC